MIITVIIFEPYSKVIKCGTLERLNNNEHLLLAKSQELFFPDSVIFSFSGKFKISYFFGIDTINNVPDIDSISYKDGIITTGNDGIPDYPQYLAQILDYANFFINDSLKYSSLDSFPVIDVTISDLTENNNYYYGFSSPITMSLKIENDFKGFLENAEYMPSVKQALDFYKVTCAHELFHLYQFALYSPFTGVDNFFFEPSAVWMEEMIYDDINDYTQYLNSGSDLFSNPLFSLNLGNWASNYDRVIWPIFLSEFLENPEVIRYAWDLYKDGYHETYEVFDSAIKIATNNQMNLDTVFREFASWVTFSDSIKYQKYSSFSEGDFFPKYTNIFIDSKDSLYINAPALSFGAIEYSSPDLEIQNFSNNYNKLDFSLTSFKEFDDIYVIDSFSFLNNNSINILQNNDSLKAKNILMFVNSGKLRDSAIIYNNSVSIEYENIKVHKEFTKFTISPNPFNPITTISFNIPNIEIPSKLIIFNINGNIIFRKTIINDTKKITVNLKNNPSGIYFVKLEVGKQSWISKMTLLK